MSRWLHSNSVSPNSLDTFAGRRSWLWRLNLTFSALRYFEVSELTYSSHRSTYNIGRPVAEWVIVLLYIKSWTIEMRGIHAHVHLLISLFSFFEMLRVKMWFMHLYHFSILTYSRMNVAMACVDQAVSTCGFDANDKLGESLYANLKSKRDQINCCKYSKRPDAYQSPFFAVSHHLNSI